MVQRGEELDDFGLRIPLWPRTSGFQNRDRQRGGCVFLGRRQLPNSSNLRESRQLGLLAANRWKRRLGHQSCGLVLLCLLQGVVNSTHSDSFLSVLHSFGPAEPVHDGGQI